eukprot:494341-Amphidinium_carterae.1
MRGSCETQRLHAKMTCEQLATIPSRCEAKTDYVKKEFTCKNNFSSVYTPQSQHRLDDAWYVFWVDVPYQVTSLPEDLY